MTKFMRPRLTNSRQPNLSHLHLGKSLEARQRLHVRERCPERLIPHPQTGRVTPNLPNFTLESNGSRCPHSQLLRKKILVLPFHAAMTRSERYPPPRNESYPLPFACNAGWQANQFHLQGIGAEASASMFLVWSLSIGPGAHPPRTRSSISAKVACTFAAKNCGRPTLWYA